MFDETVCKKTGPISSHFSPRTAQWIYRSVAYSVIGAAVVLCLSFPSSNTNAFLIISIIMVPLVECVLRIERREVKQIKIYENGFEPYTHYNEKGAGDNFVRTEDVISIRLGKARVLDEMDKDWEMRYNMALRGFVILTKDGKRYRSYNRDPIVLQRMVDVMKGHWDVFIFDEVDYVGNETPFT